MTACDPIAGQATLHLTGWEAAKLLSWSNKIHFPRVIFTKPKGFEAIRRRAERRIGAMALTAQLYLDARGSKRFRVAFDATLRDPLHAPLDVVVEDLSASGFRVLTSADLAVRVEIGLGLAGIGMHRARVVRREKGVYGCEFVTPLTSNDLRIALSAPPSAPNALPKLGPWARVPIEAARDDRPVRKLPRPARLLVIVALAVACWLLVIGIGALIFRALNSL